MFQFLKRLHEEESRKLTALVLAAFLVTFFTARLIVYLTVTGIIPNLFLLINSVHIHHFSYGVVILAVVGLYLLLLMPKFGSRRLRLTAVWYGIGLGLTFDEFGMWIRLDDDYWIRQSYDAIIVVALLLLNIAYFKPFIKILYELVWRKNRLGL